MWTSGQLSVAPVGLAAQNGDGCQSWEGHGPVDFSDGYCPLTLSATTSSSGVIGVGAVPGWVNKRRPDMTIEPNTYVERPAVRRGCSPRRVSTPPGWRFDAELRAGGSSSRPERSTSHDYLRSGSDRPSTSSI